MATSPLRRPMTTSPEAFPELALDADELSIVFRRILPALVTGRAHFYGLRTAVQRDDLQEYAVLRAQYPDLDSQFRSLSEGSLCPLNMGRA
ncbi:hypothetical protein WJX81_005863 [Elliptochloris bilobata]|uniref:Uncharacterized protein n=1 Tax=Elliptochloris bilobata TaxID=381761 RepID=A0AAW1S9U4_9CHLO